MHHVVIIGGGFGGLHTALSLRSSPVKITLIDKRNFHLFQPLLYQVATGGLSPANIAAPLRAILKHQKNVTVWLGEAHGIEPKTNTLHLKDDSLTYDSLVVATGGENAYFGHPEWESVAPGLKTIEDATRIRKKILLAFEKAERLPVGKERTAYLTFVVIGGGPTGVELAGAIGEIAHHTLRHNFRNIDPSEAQIMLIEGTDRVLSTYPPELSERALQSLHRFGIQVLTNHMVTHIQPGHVQLQTDANDRIIMYSHTILWAAGVQSGTFGLALAQATQVQPDRAGRLPVEPDLSLPAHPNIFVIGDLAHFNHQLDAPLPGVAPVAIQQGKYIAKHIRIHLKGKSLPAFKYKDMGAMATVGRASAVAVIGKWKLWGFVGWLAWLFIHLMQLVEFQNRVLVFFQWSWNYLTRNRAARLITGGLLDPKKLKKT